jgi:pSer/pThr/pTyr-binding forkhead associated (FHA) protein
MPVLQLNDKQFPLSTGPTRIGPGADVDVALPGDAALGVQAVIEGAGGGLVIRRATPAALVRVNGVVLGAEPTPLMHGDKVEVAGVEMRFADDKKGGATQFVSAGDLAAMVGARRAGAARATAASGGRLVSLVDGKEYLVADSGLVIGRDASCDVVVGQHEVSRRHAEIAPGDQGYVVRDTSANGVFVNGERVQGSHRLMRADVLRIGSEEFRFYADVLPDARATAPASVVPDATPAPAATPVVATAPVAERPAAAAAPAPAAAPVPDPVADVPSAPAPRSTVPLSSPPTEPTPRQPPVALGEPQSPAGVSLPTPLASPQQIDPRPELAVLEVLNEGPLKGSRYSLRTPLAHVGRGGHNDVQLTDESVSETHAKLQRREDGWYVVDMESTNGTYVGGSRVTGERRIDGSPDLRFGGVKTRFVAAGAGGAAEMEAKGTRAIAAVNVERPRPSTAQRPRPSSAGAPTNGPAAAPAPSRSGIPAWVWIIAALVIAAAAFFVLKGRA